MQVSQYVTSNNEEHSNVLAISSQKKIININGQVSLQMFGTKIFLKHKKSILHQLRDGILILVLYSSLLFLAVAYASQKQFYQFNTKVHLANVIQ